MSTAAATFDTTPLWRIARAFIVTFFNLFGAPEEIAAQHTLTAKTYNLMLPWLRAGEALIRRLLLIEAAALPRTPTVPQASSRQARKRTRRCVEFFPDKPDEWRVSFRCLHLAPPTGGSVERSETKGQVKRRARGFHDAWPIAERAEAMLRAFNNPAPYAKRLARRLYAEPQRARALTTYPGGAPDLIGHVDFAETREPAERAEKHFNSS